MFVVLGAKKNLCKKKKSPLLLRGPGAEKERKKKEKQPRNVANKHLAPHTKCIKKIVKTKKPRLTCDEGKASAIYIQPLFYGRLTCDEKKKNSRLSILS
jgi:hypothetical protein